jgi:hypothetical protein
MDKKRAVKRLVMVALVTILITSLLPVFGCKGEEAISEKRVLEITYKNLMDRAEQLQGNNAVIMQGQIAWAFTSSVIDATKEAINSDDGFGKSVQVQFPEKYMPENSVPTSTGALKTFVKYKGDAIWIVSISTREWEFEFNERTNEVKAKNNEAAKLLEEITLRTYHNTKYGYSVNYPPEWNVLDIIKEGVNISSVSADGTMVSAIFLFCLPKIPSLSLRDYAEQRVKSFRHDSYQIHIAEGNPTVGGIVADIVGLRFDNLEKLGNYIGYEAKWYFIEKDEKVYEILTAARPMPFENMTSLFDPYTSFQFQP